MVTFMVSVVIVDYGMGNLLSVANAFEASGAKVVVSGKKKDIESAEKIVLPGVGTFDNGMENLKKLGLAEVLTEQVVDLKKPFLGICLGLQLIAKKGFENGEHDGLAWVDGNVEKIVSGDKSLKIPHVGWNDVFVKGNSSLFYGLNSNPTFYFVHSYHLVCKNKSEVIGVCDYGIEMTAAIRKDSIFAVQFHPEKSQENGIQLLKNFLNYPKV